MRDINSNRRTFVRGCAAFAMMPLSNAVLGQTTPAVSTAGSFTLFDGFLYVGKPSPRVLGLVPIDGSGDLWRPEVSHDVVDDMQIRVLFEPLRYSSGFYYIDIENWLLRSVSAEVRRQSIEKLTQVIDLARSIAPKMHLGFYGLLPDITYWPLIRHDREYQEWLAANRETEPLAKHVDAIFPSLYTFYDDLDGWRNYARQTLIEARRYDKPIYAFLWPEYHDSKPLLRGRSIPTTFWRAELDLCAEMADGVVLWGGWKQHWNEQAPWWQETLRFMRTHGLEG